MVKPAPWLIKRKMHTYLITQLDEIQASSPFLEYQDSTYKLSANYLDGKLRNVQRDTYSMFMLDTRGEEDRLQAVSLISNEGGGYCFIEAYAVHPHHTLHQYGKMALLASMQAMIGDGINKITAKVHETNGKSLKRLNEIGTAIEWGPPTITSLPGNFKLASFIRPHSDAY